jgi:hypothetical protein
MVYSYILYIRVHKKEPSREKRKKSSHGSPGRLKLYIQWGATWFHKGIFNDIAVTAPVPNNLQHDAFRFGFGRPEPH